MSGIEAIIDTIVALAQTGGGSAILILGGVMVTIIVGVGKRVLFKIIRDGGDEFSGELPRDLF